MAGPTEPTNRTNVTNKEQQVIEDAEFENSVPVFMNSTTRVVPKGNGGGAERDVAGVVMSTSDKFSRFTENTQGKA
jgi:hypothetical protein